MKPRNFSFRLNSALVIFNCRLLLALMFAGGALAAGSTEKVLYSFQGGSDGTNSSTGLVADAAGNLYGTTSGRGTGNCTGGCGTAFELKAGPGGSWTESVIYNFQAGDDGAAPAASLIFDAAANLYGTTIPWPASKSRALEWAACLPEKQGDRSE